MKQFTIELSDLSQQHFLSLAQELDLPPETVIETFLDLMVQIFHRNLLATKKDC